MAQSKAIIPDKPEIGISSQYNFSTETDIEHPYSYATILNTPTFNLTDFNAYTEDEEDLADMDGSVIRADEDSIDKLVQIYGGSEALLVEVENSPMQSSFVYYDESASEWDFLDAEDNDISSVNINTGYIKKIIFVPSDNIDDYNEAVENYDAVYAYENSTGLPINNDKFQRKDLFTNCVGDSLNEAIIERNLKFEANPFIRIDELYVNNTGVNGETENNNVVGWMFTEAAYGGDPTKDGYSTVKSKLGDHDDWKFFEAGQSVKGENEDIGDIDEITGKNIVENFGAASTDLQIGNFVGQKWTRDDVENSDGPFKLDATSESMITSLFNQSERNPLYVVIYTRGDYRGWVNLFDDDRKRRYHIFKLNNLDFFTRIDDDFIGKVSEFTFNRPTSVKQGDGGGGKTSAAWEITSFKISINTSAGQQNSFSDVGNYKNFTDRVIAPVGANENTWMSYQWLTTLGTSRQLSNLQKSGIYTNMSIDRHPDFFPITTFGFTQNGIIGNNYSDLQTYHQDFNSISKASAPLGVTLNIDIKDIYGINLGNYNGVGDRIFYYFIIDWNDKFNVFNTVEDWVNSFPRTEFEYLEKQKENLYKVKKINLTNDSDDGTLSNIYSSPGMKNIKFMVISVFDGNGIDEDSPDFEVGRWKLCTSRIFLDIPPNQYPDFNDVGGSDYTTIPWPYTSPIIGGVSENSKYKKSVEKILSSGKIGNLDIIDEKLLVNSRDNSELGKNIKSMDLEQCRYFNTGSYNMNTLLGVDTITEDGFRPYNYIVDSPNHIEDVNFSRFVSTPYDTSNQWMGETAETEYPYRRNRTSDNIDIPDIYEQKNYPNDDIKKGIRIKYGASRVYGGVYTLFRYQRKDLHKELKTFEEGGTEYIFKFQIKFNQWDEHAPEFYVFRPANRDNDYGTPFHSGSGFNTAELGFFPSEDGIYSNRELTNKLGNYGEWIDVERTRKLISDYSSYRLNGNLEEKNGYPNMEFLTSNWTDNFRKTIYLPFFNMSGDLEEVTLIEADNLNDDGEIYSYVEFEWDGDDGFEVTGTSVILPIIKITERNQLNGDSINNTLNRIGWNYQNLATEDEDAWTDYDLEAGAYGENTYWVRPENELGSGNPSEGILSTGLLQGKIYRFHFPPNASGLALESAFVDEWVYDGVNAELEYGPVNPTSQYLDFEIRGPIMMEYEKYLESPISLLNQDRIYWDGNTNKFPMESSVGQIFISDNQDLDLKQSCKIELNTGNLVGKSIYDSSGNSNKGLLIGDYKLRKMKKGQPMRRESFVKVPKKKSNRNGAL